MFVVGRHSPCPSARAGRPFGGGPDAARRLTDHRRITKRSRGAKPDTGRRKNFVARRTVELKLKQNYKTVSSKTGPPGASFQDHTAQCAVNDHRISLHAPPAGAPSGRNPSVHTPRSRYRSVQAHAVEKRRIHRHRQGRGHGGSRSQARRRIPAAPLRAEPRGAALFARW